MPCCAALLRFNTMHNLLLRTIDSRITNRNIFIAGGVDENKNYNNDKQVLNSISKDEINIHDLDIIQAFRLQKKLIPKLKLS
jgi:hypothetical protein